MSSFHFFARSWGMFDVYKLFELIKGIRPTTLDAKELWPMLSLEMWDYFHETHGEFIQINANDTVDRMHPPEHVLRIMNADLQYPIMVLDQSTIPEDIRNPKDIFGYTNSIRWRYDVIDGMHRLAKQKILGHTQIQVILVPWDVIQKAKIGNFWAWIFGISMGWISRESSGRYVLSKDTDFTILKSVEKSDILA